MLKRRKKMAAATVATIGLVLFAPAIVLAGQTAAQDAATAVADSALSSEGQEGTKPPDARPNEDNAWSMKMFVALAAGLGLGLAAAGGALGQARAAAAALDGIARNPGASGKIFTPMILALALIESLVIYSLVISILLYTKL